MSDINNPTKFIPDSMKAEITKPTVTPLNDAEKLIASMKSELTRLRKENEELREVLKSVSVKLQGHIEGISGDSFWVNTAKTRVDNALKGE